MTKVKPKVRRQMLTLFCALLLFGQIFVPAAYAGREQNVNISYTVTEDMLPKPVPTATPKPVPTATPSPKPTATPAPTATPHPGKGEPPKTGDESKVLVYGLLAAGSALAALGLFVFLNKKEEEDLTHE
ncbi:MAG: LPXTG cell wall anchor domain-containing protein [Candidatus Limivicinus sp.]